MSHKSTAKRSWPDTDPPGAKKIKIHFHGKRNIGIDLLRGLSILYIVGFWHLFNYTEAFPKYNNFLTYRFTLIILGTFVFISGYFIGIKDIVFNKHAISDFYKTKLLRIYPLYLIAISLFTFFNLSNLLTSLKAGLLISMFIKPAPPTLWFITMLMLYYVISPFIIQAYKTIEIRYLMICYIFFIAILIYYPYFTKKLDIRIIMYFPSFAFGIFVAAKQKMETIKNSKGFYLSIIITILVSFFKTPHSQLNSIMKIPMILLCSYFIFTLSKKIVVTSTHVYKKIIFLSYSSYCMYLFHRPIFISLKKIYFPNDYLYQIVYLVIFCLPCILFCSFTIQKLFDVVIISLTNRSN